MHFVTSSRRKRQGAFTLIELLITISVLGVLMAVALPNLQGFVLSNRLSSDVNGFLGLINYARSEAIARSQDVVICPKSNGAITCENTQFWGEFETQAFVDLNGNGQRNVADILLKTLPASDPTGSARGFNKSVVGGVRFGAVGISQSSHKFEIYAKKTGDLDYETRYGRTICISRPGRARVTPYLTAACDGF